MDEEDARKALDLPADNDDHLFRSTPVSFISPYNSYQLNVIACPDKLAKPTYRQDERSGTSLQMQELRA